jgi:hypothetical protein
MKNLSLLLAVALLCTLLSFSSYNKGKQAKLEEIKERVRDNFDYYEDSYSAEELDYIIFGV